MRSYPCGSLMTVDIAARVSHWLITVRAFTELALASEPVQRLPIRRLCELPPPDPGVCKVLHAGACLHASRCRDLPQHRDWLLCRWVPLSSRYNFRCAMRNTPVQRAERRLRSLPLP